jgi:hypothetical protein
MLSFHLMPSIPAAAFANAPPSRLPNLVSVANSRKPCSNVIRGAKPNVA